MSLCLQGDRETFENYYRKQRKKQARLVLQPQANMVSQCLVDLHVHEMYDKQFLVSLIRLSSVKTDMVNIRM